MSENQTPDETAPDALAPDAVTPQAVEPDAAPGEREWWDDPSLPWRHKPARADIVCFGWIAAVGIYGIVITPLRPAMLAYAPQIFGAMGHYSGLIMTGALAATGDRWWPLVWAIGLFGLVKFDWIYWWAGRLWGHNLIEVWSGKSERTRRRNDRAERFARKHETLALIVAMLPIPVSSTVIFVVLGAAGTTLRKFLTVVLCTSVVYTGGYLALGYAIGAPAVHLVEQYATWLLWASVAIAVVMIVAWVVKGRGKNDKKRVSPSM